MKEIIIESLKEIGVTLYLEDFQEDFNLQDYIVDSLQFVSFIVMVENRLNITFPDDLLTYDTISSSEAFLDLLERLTSESSSVDDII